MRPLAVVPGTTLAEVVARAWDGAEPPIGAVDGRVVPSAQWAATRLAGTEIVTLRSSVAGDDSNPLRVVLLIAVTWAALTIPGAQWGLGLEGWGASLASAGIAVGGQLLVNAIAPLPTPDVSTPGRPEAVYSLTGGRNQARAYQPMPLVLGEHRVVPDLAAAPYSELEGDDQYLYTAFHFGLGNLQITDLKIGGTPIASYSDVTRSWPGELGEAGIGRERLLAGDVDTQAVGDLVSHTEWTERSISAGATRVALDLAGRIFRVNDSGGYESITVVVDVEIYATTPGDVRRTALDTTVSLTSDSPTPVRQSVSWNLPADDPQPTPGTTWKLRLKRAAAPTPDTDRDYDDVACTALRSYAPDTADYAGQHRLEMKIRASEQLSGPLDQITALVRQQVPTPAGAGWGPPAASSNPAWIFRWFALGVRIGGRLVAGAGLPESRIDDASIRAWGAWCDTQQLRCDHVIQAAASVHDVLAVIAQCGRASPSWSSGRLGVVYEDPARLPSAMITPGNILAGTLEIDYAAGRKVDEVAVRYLSPALDWQYATLRRRAAGITAPEHSVTQTLPGVTTDRQAAMSANLLLAAQTWRRRRIRWQMGPAALTQIRRGDVVWLSHALLDGGVAGRLLGLDGAAVALDREIEVAHGDHVLLMLPDGTLHATTVAGTVGTRSRITLAAAPPDPAPGDPPWTPADVLWRVYDSSTPPVRARILGVEPQSEQVVRIVAVDDPPEYHAAATSDLTGPTATQPGPPARVVSIYAWTERQAASSGETCVVHIAVQVAGRWTGGEVVVSTAGGPQRVPQGRIGETDRGLSWPAARDATLTITVIPDGAPGGEHTITYAVDGPPELAPPMRWRGAWASGTAYGQQDGVSYGGRGYICTTSHVASSSNRPSGSAAANAWWDLLADRGIPGGRGPKGLAGDDGEPGSNAIGPEHIFARTTRAIAGAALRSTDLPDNAWAFDYVDNSGRGRVRGRLTWHDGDPGRSAANPALLYTWRWLRFSDPPVKLTGAEASKSNWRTPVVIVEDGADGGRGLTGHDGDGYEHIYARTATSITSLRSTDLPDNTWTFDYVDNGGRGRVRGRLTWHDGDPGYTSARPVLWHTYRQIRGADRSYAKLPGAAGNWRPPTIMVDNVHTAYDSHCMRIDRMLICWGIARGVSGGDATITYPTSAGTYAHPPTVLITLVGDPGPSNRGWAPRIRDTMYVTTTTCVVRGLHTPVYWLAIGYVT